MASRKNSDGKIHFSRRIVEVPATPSDDDTPRVKLFREYDGKGGLREGQAMNKLCVESNNFRHIADDVGRVLDCLRDRQNAPAMEFHDWGKSIVERLKSPMSKIPTLVSAAFDVLRLVTGEEFALSDFNLTDDHQRGGVKDYSSRDGIDPAGWQGFRKIPAGSGQPQAAGPQQTEKQQITKKSR